MTRRRCLHAAIPLLLLLAGAAPEPLLAATDHPVAAARAPHGSLFVLTAEHRVFAVNMSLSSGAVVASFPLPAGGIATDLAYGEVAGQGMLFISSTFSTGQAVVGKVQQFTTGGTPVQSWTTQHIVAGVAFAPATQTVYFTSGDSPEIYSIALQPKSSPHFVAEVTGGSSLGALTLDTAGQNLYIADIRQGSVFSMNLGTHKVAPVCQVSTPQALLVDSSDQQLIVADSTRRQVVDFSLRHPAAPKRVLAPAGTFDAPAGLAWWDPTHLLVADQNGSTVSMIDVGAAQRLYAVPVGEK